MKKICFVDFDKTLINIDGIVLLVGVLKKERSVLYIMFLIVFLFRKFEFIYFLFRNVLIKFSFIFHKKAILEVLKKEVNVSLVNRIMNSDYSEIFILSGNDKHLLKMFVNNIPIGIVFSGIYGYDAKSPFFYNQKGDKLRNKHLLSGDYSNAVIDYYSDCEDDFRSFPVEYNAIHV